MLIGAGRAAALALREFSGSSYSENRVVCLIDDDAAKQGRYLQGVKIVGGQASIVEAAQKYNVDEIIFAIPSATHQQRKELLAEWQKTGCRLKTLPGICQLANGEVSIKEIRDVEIEDLLGRDAVKVDLSDIIGYIGGRVILVTGEAGASEANFAGRLPNMHRKRLLYSIFMKTMHMTSSRNSGKNTLR